MRGIVDPAVRILVEDVEDGHEQALAKFSVAVLSKVNRLAGWMLRRCFIQSPVLYLEVRVQRWRHDVVLDGTDDAAL